MTSPGVGMDPFAPLKDRRVAQRVKKSTTTTGRDNGFTADRCEVDGCSARVHGRGLCRTHYDEQRYADTVARDLLRTESEFRELDILEELQFGSPLSRRAGESMFATEAERREAWEERKDEMLADYLAGAVVGNRPWAWWEYVAGRPHHLEPWVPARELGETTEEQADAYDEREMEPMIFLAEGGHLTEREIEAIEANADEARPRIGTDAEQIGSGGVDRADRRRVELWEAVREALR